MKKVLLSALFVCLFAGGASAATGDLVFNDDSAQGQLNFILSEDDYGATLLNARLLHNEDEETTLGSVGLDFFGSPGNVPGLKYGLGGQLSGGQTDDDQDILALGIGGRVEFAPPAFGGFGLSGKLYYAPDIFSTLDAERVVETGLRASYAMTPKVKLIAEYQNIRTKLEDEGTWNIDDDIRFGFEASF